MKTVVLVGTLDTKGAEYQYLRDRLKLSGVKSLLVDVGTLEPPTAEPDVSRYEVGAAAGVDVDALTAARDRGQAVSVMADAAAIVVKGLFAEGRCDGVLAAGGSGNTAIATKAMRALPVGVPKLMVSTMAAGNTRDYIGASDIALMASVTDVAGINSISGRILANAAAAMAGMVNAPPVELGEQRPLIAATMFGVTTPSVTAAREELERRGYEVLTFHATGTGGRAMEALVESGFVQAGRAASSVGGRAGHGQLRRARHGASAVRVTQSLRPQPVGDAHEDDPGGVRGARPADSKEAVGGPRARGAFHSPPRRLCDLRRGRPLLRRGRRQSPVQRAAREHGQERRDARG